MAGGIGGLPSPGLEGAASQRRMRPNPPEAVMRVREQLIPFPTGHVLRELPAAERPRERLQLRGAAGLTAAELIALLWGSGTPGRSAIDVATEAIARFDGLSGLARASSLELETVPGSAPRRRASCRRRSS